MERRGWPNCGLCPLCKQALESVSHIFFKCRYSIRLWGMIKGWLKLDYLDISSWMTMRSIKDWWLNMSATNMPNRKAMASLTMLTCWSIW